MQARRQLRCSICKQAYGACIQCSGHKHCFTAFHPLCARAAGLVMDSVHDETFSPDDSPPPESVGTLSQVDTTAGGPAPEAKRRRRGSWYEGTAVGDGTKLVSIPASWVAMLLFSPCERVPWAQLGAPSSFSASIAACRCRKSSCCPQVCYCRRHQPQQQPLGTPAGTQAGRQSPRVAAGPWPSPDAGRRLDGDAADSSRCRPFDHALRRGLRAPEVVAAAIAKRSFLRAEAYQVSSCHMCTQQDSTAQHSSRLYALLCLADSGQRPCPTVPKAMAVLLLPCFASSRATLHPMHLQPPCCPVQLGLGVTDLLLSHAPLKLYSGHRTLSTLRDLVSGR